MSSMRTWVKMTKKRVRCTYCTKWIETGYYQVVCQYFMNTKSGKNWVKRMHFCIHEDGTSCWVERAIQELRSRPQTETRGRKKADISDVDKTQRIKIMTRRAATMQRMRIEMDGKMRPSTIAHLSAKLEKLRVEVGAYGGAPEGW